jgi:catechol 2,3-dioxygenase-like lactoylglutathione lyase family enzyme
MLRGLTTVAYQTTDLAAAKRWYADLLGVEPYFDRPQYAEFRIGDYQHELGLLDSRYTGELGAEATSPAGPAGAIVYWHVDDGAGDPREVAVDWDEGAPPAPGLR